MDGFLQVICRPYCTKHHQGVLAECVWNKANEVNLQHVPDNNEYHRLNGKMFHSFLQQLLLDMRTKAEHMALVWLNLLSGFLLERFLWQPKDVTHNVLGLSLENDFQVHCFPLGLVLQSGFQEHYFCTLCPLCEIWFRILKQCLDSSCSCKTTTGIVFLLKYLLCECGERCCPTLGTLPPDLLLLFAHNEPNMWIVM